jgi:hypothetical protein
MKYFTYRYQNGSTGNGNGISLEEFKESLKYEYRGGPLSKVYKFIVMDSFKEITETEMFFGRKETEEETSKRRELIYQMFRSVKNDKLPSCPVPRRSKLYFGRFENTPDGHQKFKTIGKHIRSDRNLLIKYVDETNFNSHYPDTTILKNPNQKVVLERKFSKGESKTHFDGYFRIRNFSTK